MKNIIIPSIILLFCMTLSPLFAKNTKDNKAIIQNANQTEENKTNPLIDKSYFSVKRTNKNIIEKISEKDYIIGCISGEIPTTYNKEAIKAQAVASYTFACRKRENSKNEYDITDDYTIDQCFFDKNEQKEKWGNQYESKIKIIQKAVDEVFGEYLEYDGKYALTVYHAISPGKTNTSKEVWGSEISYLTTVDSSCDRLSENYKNVITISNAEFKEKIKTDESPKLEKTDNGRVEKLIFKKTTILGTDFAKLFNLKSCNFDISKAKGNFVITTYGYGHGVGMSQNGANCMAENGSNYAEILKHYYPGCVIRKQ